MRLLTESALVQERVLKDPGPSVNLTNFGPDGLEFTLNYWMIDPENGQQNLRSGVNLSVLAALRAHDIEIPLPQRVVHVKADPQSSTEASLNGGSAIAFKTDTPV